MSQSVETMKLQVDHILLYKSHTIIFLQQVR